MTKLIELTAQKKSSFGLDVRKTLRVRPVSSSPGIGRFPGWPGCTATGRSSPRSGCKLCPSRHRMSRARSISWLKNKQRRESEEDFRLLIPSVTQCGYFYLCRHQKHDHISFLFRVVDLQHQMESRAEVAATCAAVHHLRCTLALQVNERRC